MSKVNRAEVAAQTFWDISLIYHGRCDKQITTSDAIRGLGRELETLSPERPVTNRILYLQHYIITGERPCVKSKINSSVPTPLSIQPTNG